MAIEAAGGELDVTGVNAPASAPLAIRLVADAAEWDGLMTQAPMPYLPQDYGYGEAKAATGWHVVRAVFERAGKVVAFVTIMQLRKLGLTLVNRINRGPIFVDDEPDDTTILAVYRSLRRRWGRAWTGPLTIAPALLDSARSRSLLRQAGYVVRHQHSWQSGRVDLTVGETAMAEHMSSSFRNRLRKAQASSAELRISDDAETYEWMIARHLDNMADKGFRAAGPALLRRLREASQRGVTVFQMMHEGQPVAGMSVARFGRIAEYHIGWFGPEGRALNAGNFLMWGILVEMARRGVQQLDVGGLREGDGYTQFKRTMKPVEYRLAGEWVSF